MTLRQWLPRLLLGLYLVFLAVCLLGVLVDPPSHLDSPEAYKGMIGLIASAAAGFPWSFVVLGWLATVAQQGAPGLWQHPALAFGLCWAGAVVNVVLLWLYLRRVGPRGPGRDA